MAQSHDDQDHQFKGNSILSKVSLSNVDTLIDKENSLFSEGKYEEAIPTYDKVLSTDPNNTDALVEKQLAILIKH